LEAAGHGSECPKNDTLSKIGLLPQNLKTILALQARAVGALVGTASQDPKATTKQEFQLTEG